MSHVPSGALSKAHLSSLLLHCPGRNSLFLGISLIHCSQELSQSHHTPPPLAAGSTWHADEETLFVVLFGLIIHGHHAGNTWSCFLNSP